MAISILQSAINTSQFSAGSNATVSVTLSGVTAGSSIAVLVSCETVTVTGVSDGTGYTQRQTVFDSGNSQHCYLFTLDGASSGSHTVVATFSAGASWDAIEAFEIGETAGYNTSASQYQATPGTGTDAVSSTAITPGSGGCLILGWSQDTGSGSTPSAGTGFTAYSSHDTLKSRSEYLVQGSAASVAATFTSSTNTGHCTFVAAFTPTTVASTKRLMTLGAG